MRSTETAMAHIVLLRCPKRNGVTPGNGAWAQGKLRQKHVALKSLLSFRGKGGKVHPKPAVKATLGVWCVWDLFLCRSLKWSTFSGPGIIEDTYLKDLNSIWRI